MGAGKKRLIFTGVVLAAIIVLFVGIGIGRRANNNSQTTEADVVNDTGIEKTDSVTETDNSVDDNADSADEQDDSGAFEYEVTQNQSSSWEQDGKYVAQFDIVLKNNSSEALSDWKLTFDNVNDAEILTGWNGKFEISGGVLTITPESYNGTVDPNTSVDCGVQIKFADEASAGKVSKNGSLYIAGKQADVSKMQAAGSGDGADGDKALNADNKAASSDNDSNSKNKDAVDSDTAVDDNESGTARGKKVVAETGTPFANHGALSVKGTDIVDKSGKQYQLKGVSTHGLAWFPDYVNKDAFATFRDDWGANVIRLAMYTDEGGGYCTDGNKDNLKKLVKKGIDEATELGMYVIVDWHILHDLTPLKYENEAKKFFEEFSSEYKDSDNIIYEICNEPNGGTGWADVKKYAEDIIPIIRKNDDNAIIVVGTPTWSQDVDEAAKDPIKGYDNIMYTLHFYAATHKDDLRKKLTKAKNSGLPIFITEFSICEASGNGSVDYDSANAWFDLISENNLSYCAWNVSNKDEKSSLIKSNVSKKSGWSEDDLSETGVYIKKQMK